MIDWHVMLTFPPELLKSCYNLSRQKIYISVCLGIPSHPQIQIPPRTEHAEIFVGL